MPIRVALNLVDAIVFEQTAAPPEDPPRLSLELVAEAAQNGVAFDVTGDSMPLLSAHDIRKLVKWLNNAAAQLDGESAVKKNKSKKRREHYEEEDDEYGAWA